MNSRVEGRHHPSILYVAQHFAIGNNQGIINHKASHNIKAGTSNPVGPLTPTFSQRSLKFRALLFMGWFRGGSFFSILSLLRYVTHATMRRRGLTWAYGLGES